MKKIITGIVLFVLGIVAILYGVFARESYYDLTTLTDDNIGQDVTVEMSEPLPIDERSYLISYDEQTVEIRAEIPDALSRRFERLVEQNVPIKGTVRKCTDEMQEESFKALNDYLEMLAEFTEGFEVTDEVREQIRDCISPYYIEVTEVNTGLVPTLKTAAFIAGGVLLFAALIVLISLISKKAVRKVFRVVLAVILIPAAIICIIFMDKIITVCSIRSDGDGVYYMEYKGEYKLDDMLSANIKSDKELIEWISKAEFCGLPIDYDFSRFGCASFKANTPDGKILLGRNFDYPETDTLMIYSSPKDGYASYSMADLEVMGIRPEHGSIDPDSLPGRFLMLAAPYVACDGVNEAGLGVSTLQLEIGEIHQDTGKPDLYVYTAIRVILDKCATVDEALDLLGAYDIHSHADVRQHLFIADKSGRSVVVEWFDDQMYVNELDAVTNSVVTPGEHYDEGADRRLPAITAGLSEHEGILTPEQARDLLESVKQNTEWSCVYHLNDFAVDLYVDEDYTQAYNYGGAN